jgi:hypothetical protein
MKESIHDTSLEIITKGLHNGVLNGLRSIFKEIVSTIVGYI